MIKTQAHSVLCLVLQKKNLRVFTLPFIRKWLNDQDNYLLLKGPRHCFQIAKVWVTSIDEQYDADLTSVENLKKYNDGVRFLLFLIDIFSRYLGLSLYMTNQQKHF